MRITIPTTSTKLNDILTQAQKDTMSAMLKKRHGKLRCEAHGGTAWWISDGTASINQCNSILDGDIEYISIELDNIAFIASSGVTINIDIV